jgi:peptidyl-prolyl cis-trans isomerase B (cyclophilin B)
MANAGYASRI